MDSKDEEKLKGIMDALKADDAETLYSIVEVDPSKDDDFSKELFKGLGRTIDSIEGGTDYLLDIFKNSGFEDINTLYLIAFSSDFEKMKHLIDHKDEYNLPNVILGELYSGLARSSEYKDIAAELLMDPEKIEELGLMKFTVKQIACEFKDSEIVERFLNSSELVEANKEDYFYFSSNTFFPSEIVEIIASTEDPEYIKRYLTDKSLIEKMRFSKLDIANLMIASKDEELVKKGMLDSKAIIILEAFEYGNFEQLYEMAGIEPDKDDKGHEALLGALGKTLDDFGGGADYLKQKFKEKQDEKAREKLEKIINPMSTHSYTSLYLLTEINQSADSNDHKALFEALGRTVDGIEGGTENLLKMYEESSYENKTMVYLMSLTSDFEKMQFLIDHKEEYGLNPSDLGPLFVGLTRSPEHRGMVAEMIMDKEKCQEQGIYFKNTIKNIVCAFKDPVIVDSFINNSEIVDYSGSPEAGKEGKLQYTSQDIADMIRSTESKEYIKEHASDEELIEKYGFTADAVAMLAIESQDKETMRSFLYKQGALLDNKMKIDLIFAINDPEIMRQAIEDPEFLHLQIEDIYTIAFDGSYSREEISSFPVFQDKKTQMIFAYMAGDEKYIEENLPNIDAEINLPEDMTIGVEIESVGPLSGVIDKRGRVNDWTAKKDGSVKEKGRDGVEVVSPILSGDNKESTNKVKKVASILEGVGQYANDSCGGHVHIGANYLKSKQAFGNLQELWANNEKLLYIISNKEGEIPRSGIRSYASPVSKELEEKLPDAIQIDGEEDLESFKREIAERQESRYRGINFKNLGPSGKGTVEFRLSNGTVDAKTWIENINLYGGLVRASQEIAVIQAKNPSERTDEENNKLAIFDRLGTDEKMQDEERLDALLSLAIPDPKKREIYKARYRTNNELIQGTTVDESLEEDVSKKLVRYSKKAIGKEIFTGDKAISGENIQEINNIISRDEQEITRENEEERK